MEEMNIYEVLKCFRAPLSEEQAWAVCYQCAKELISQREKGFRTFQKQLIDVKLATTKILKDGSVEFTNISPAKSPQKENELLLRLGSLVYECLDYGMEACMERELDPSLEKLILDMTCEHGDEGISILEEFEAGAVITKESSLTKRERLLSSNGEIAKDMTLENVLRKCTEHLVGDTSDPPGHFRAVCRALVNEALELTAFLHQLYNGQALLSQHMSRSTGLTNWAYLQSLHAAEWAQLWLQAMKELRQGVTLRRVVHGKLPPASYEVTPFEMLLDDIRYHRFHLNHVSFTTQRKKEDAHDIILEFIRSRPPLAKSSQRKMNPLVETSPNLHDKLLNEIKSGKALKATPQPMRKTAREIYYGEGLSLSSSEISPYVAPKRRKCLKPEIQFVETIYRWDSPSPSEISMEEISSQPSESRPESPRTQLFEEFESESDGQPSRFKEMYPNFVRQASASSQSSMESIEDNCVRNGRFNSFEFLPGNERPMFPPSLRALRNMKVTSKIYMTLEEVKHMRKTLAKLELESFDPEERLYRDLAIGKLCFCCRKRKFSLFGHWSRPCEICESKVCVYCIHKVEPSSSYVFMEKLNLNRRDSGFFDAYWPFTATMSATQSSSSLGADSADTKVHKVCVSCKRFISKHC